MSGTLPLWMSMTAVVDPRGAPPVRLTVFDRWALERLRDPRDLIFARVTLGVTLTCIPSALLIYAVPTWAVPLLLVPHMLIVWVLWGGRYMLMLHAMCHRQTYKRDSNWLNVYATNVVGFLFGCTPMSFFAHHMGMHHAENNLEEDLSSTLPYRRDSFAGFLHYYARFAVFSHLHLPRYFALRKRSKLYWNVVVGETSWVVLVALLGYLNPWATLGVLVVPWLMIRWFLMCGNFAQHAFVDVDDPGNSYRNSTCLTETTYNRKAYNDGYHIVHHINPSLHWSEMASWYDENLAEFAANDAVVFRGIQNNQTIWWHLMLGRYDHLADHLVEFRGRSHAERVAFLKSRVQRKKGRVPGLTEREPALAAA